MIHQVRCKDCHIVMSQIEKDTISKEDIEMYDKNSICEICEELEEKHSPKIKNIITSTHKLLRKMKLKK